MKINNNSESRECQLVATRGDDNIHTFERRLNGREIYCKIHRIFSPKKYKRGQRTVLNPNRSVCSQRCAESVFIAIKG